MKRIGFIFEKICSRENIRLAIIEAARNKHKKKSVIEVLDNLESYVEQIHEMLLTRAFHPSAPIIKQHYEPLQRKTRQLTILPFYPDQIVQHAVMRIVIPTLRRGMYEYCCSNVPGRGEKHIRLHLSKILKNDARNSKYCLKFDIKQFYPSVSLTLLKQKLRRIIKDEKALALLDELLTVQKDGLTLGSYSSQWLANFFLQDLDHFIKEKLQIRYMYRYADDIVMLDSNRRKLLKAFYEIKEFLRLQKLEIKPSWRLFLVNNKESIDFVGYRFYRNKISIRKRIFKNVRRCLLKIRHAELNQKLIRSFMSYLGYIKNSNSYKIQNTYLKGISMPKLKRLLK